MCNNVHINHTVPRKKSGIGYKLVTIAGNSLVSSIRYQKTNNKIIWKFDIRPNRGFCFFFNKKEAERALKIWESESFRRNNTIIKIHYNDCLARQDEKGFIGGYTFDIGICLEWSSI